MDTCDTFEIVQEVAALNETEIKTSRENSSVPRHKHDEVITRLQVSQKVEPQIRVVKGDNVFFIYFSLAFYQDRDGFDYFIGSTDLSHIAIPLSQSSKFEFFDQCADRVTELKFEKLIPEAIQSPKD